MKASSLRIVAAYLSGLADSGVDLNGGIALPLLLKPQLSGLLQSAVLLDENRPNSIDPFEPFGVWHRAVNSVMYALSQECRAMTEHYDYPQGLGLGDGAFQSFMSAIRDFYIELPSAAAMVAADAEREQLAAREWAAATARAAALRAQDEADSDDTYNYS